MRQMPMDGYNMEISHQKPVERIRRLQKTMLDAGIDVILLNYSRSTLYYGGTTQPSILIITPDRYHLMVVKGMEFVREETWLDPRKVSHARGYEEVKAILNDWGLDRRCLGMELDILPAAQYLRISKLFTGFNIVDISPLLLEQRRIKDSGEIAYTREACCIVHQSHKRILEVLREGMTELELSSEVEDAQRKAGHEGLYFMRQFDFFMGRGPMASGENLSKIAGRVQSISGVGISPSIPLGASLKKIKKGEMIVVDIPSHYHGYHCDQSRTYVLGEPPVGCENLYRGLKEISDRIIGIMKPGVSCDYLYDKAMKFADEIGLEPYFMKLGNDTQKLSFIGHGVGLELNEPPMVGKKSKDVIEEGMIIALELEMCRSRGEVVKLEDTLLVSSDGAEILTITPRDLHQV